MNTQIFAEHTLVLTHLPDPTRGGTAVPVSGVVVRPGTTKTVIKVRDKAGHTQEIALSNNLLSYR